MIVKRPTHPRLQAAEALIEDWRHNLVQTLKLPPEQAAYLLTSTSWALTRVQSARAGDAGTALKVARRHMYALEFGIRVMGANLPSAGQVTESIAEKITTEENTKIAANIIGELGYYGEARDTFLSYYFGAFDLVDGDNARDLVFVDNPSWSGELDFAQVALSLETMHERTTSGAPFYELLSEFPWGLDMGELSSDAFLKLWGRLTATVMDGYAPVMTRAQLVAVLESPESSRKEIDRFLDLITFPTGNSPLTFFHCPLLQLTTEDFQVVSPALVSANLSGTVKRLATQKGPGVDAVSKHLESSLLGRLEEHFSNEAMFRFDRNFTRNGEEGEIDCAVYEPARGILTLCQAKTFIPPDTVPEVFAANQQLAKGLDQLRRTERWCRDASLAERRRVLGLPDLADDAEMRYALLGNGFVGSDHLEHPDHILLGDIVFLLRPQFQGGSFVQALGAFTARLRELAANSDREVQEQSIEIAGVRMRFPAILREY